MNLTLFKKEIRLNLFRPSSLFITACLSLYLGVQYFYQLGHFSKLTQDAVASGGSSLLENLWAPYFGQLNMILMFTSPFFVARLFAEEKRQDAMLSLLASPLSSLSMLMQKFFAGWCILLLFCAVAFVFPLTSLVFFPEVYLPELFMGLFTICLVSGVYSAISLFCGALFESLMLGGVFSIVVNLSLWSLGIIFRDLITFKRAEWVEEFWIGKHLTELLVAKLSLSSLYFFSALTFLFLFLSYQILDEVERG